MSSEQQDQRANKTEKREKMIPLQRKPVNKDGD